MENTHMSDNSPEPLTPRQALLLAIEIVGGQMQLAIAMGKKNQTSVSQWLRTGQVPVKHVLKLEHLTGVSRHVLRPDIYPRDNPAPMNDFPRRTA
jgi:DNA-binding transcriptional regulator YdaS (Cro superfamily)